MQTRVISEQIATPPDRVWSFIADLCNDTIWRGEITHVELLSGVPRQKGAVYRESVKWQQFTADVDLMIVDSDSPARLVVAAEGPAYQSRSLWTFEPAGGGTLVTLVFSMEASGAYVLAEGLITDMVAKWLERDLPQLGAHLHAL